VIAEHHIAVTRTARYYTVGGDGETRESGLLRELWIVCHGYGQLAGTFIESFATVATPSRLIAAPEALSRFYLDPSRSPSDALPRAGAAWMTREDRENEIADQIRYLDALHERLRPAAIRDRVRLRVLGFSQGVATAGRWAAYGNARPSQLILWAGKFPPDIDLRPLAEKLAGAPVLLVTGRRDSLASWSAADQEAHRFADAGIDATLMSFDGGHRLDNATLAAISDA
jgi:predicted esterase